MKHYSGPFFKSESGNKLEMCKKQLQLLKKQQQQTS